jgi:hypothetical protein
MTSITSSKFIIADNDAVLSKKKKVEVIFYPRLLQKNNWNFPNLKPFCYGRSAQIDYGGHEMN